MLIYINKLYFLFNNESRLSAEGPYSVVLVPSRELAQQIEEEIKKLAHFTYFTVISVVGGTNIEEQAYKLKQGCDMVIATPGRLIDCIERRFVVLNHCHYVVLDEADRMIDMGFEPQVQSILDALTLRDFNSEYHDSKLNSK